MPKKKEIFKLPSLKTVLAKSETPPPPPEEPKFYGSEFADLIQTFRKMGTLRQRDQKRAGLIKGTRITGHVHPDSQSPSVIDIPLVILDVYHGPLKSVFSQHPLSFLLDGIGRIEEAVSVLQKFSPEEITPRTPIDYFCFIQASLFDQLSPQNQKRLLALPVEKAMATDLGPIFFPSLCQACVWHGGGIYDWIRFLEKIRAIDATKANSWRELKIGGMASQVVSHFDTPESLQKVLLAGPEDSRYNLLVLGRIEQLA